MNNKIWITFFIAGTAINIFMAIGNSAYPGTFWIVLFNSLVAFICLCNIFYILKKPNTEE